MSTGGVDADRIGAQRALEALRNGVPNSDAVRALGCMQPEALDRFRSQLDELAEPGTGDGPPVVPGSLIAGGFGTGKSHTLSSFEQEALQRNFVVSKVVISKETPLYDPTKLFAAAVREARLPESRGSLLHELAIGMDYRSGRATPFVDWATRVQPYGMVAASVVLHDRSHNAELQEQIINWWSGDKLGVPAVRAGLRDLDMAKAFEIKAVKLADLAPIRFEFAARLARARGFAGWVILIDEVELIARYSLLQRAKAYASLANWLGLVPGIGVPGTTVIAAITDDFDINVLESRNDREKAPARLSQRDDAAGLAIAAMAQAGIDAITRDAIHLRPPNDDTLGNSFGRLRDLYALAYGVTTSERSDLGDGTHRAMRSYVRRWISDWDLERLFPDQAHDSLEEEVQLEYGEDPDLQRDSEERSAEDA